MNPGHQLSCEALDGPFASVAIRHFDTDLTAIRSSQNSIQISVGQALNIPTLAPPGLFSRGAGPSSSPFLATSAGGIAHHLPPALSCCGPISHGECIGKQPTRQNAVDHYIPHVFAGSTHKVCFDRATSEI